MKIIYNIPGQRFFILLGLILILALHGVVNYYWQTEDNTPWYNWDAEVHLCLSQEKYYKISEIMPRDISGIKDGLGKARNLLKDFLGQSYWTDLVYVITSLFNILFGNSLFVTRMTMTLWFFALIIGTYFLGAIIGSFKVGLWSAFLVSMFPAAFRLSRGFGLDMPLAAVVVAGIVLLLKTESFTNKKYSVLFGFFSGFGILIKIQFLFYLLGPTLIQLFVIFTEEGERRKRIRLFTLSLLIAILTSSLWWVDKLDILYRALNTAIFYKSIWSREIMDGVLTSGRAFYPLLLFISRWLVEWVNSMGILLSIVISAAFVYFLAFYNNRKYKYMLISTSLLPLFIYTFILSGVSPADRYQIPDFSITAVVLGWSLLRIRWRKPRFFISIMLCLFLVLQFFVFSFKAEAVLLPEKISRYIKHLYFNASLDRIRCFHPTFEPHFVDRKIDKVAEVLRSSCQKEKKKISIITYTDQSGMRWQYLLGLNDKNFIIKNIAVDSNEEFLDFDFLIFLATKHFVFPWPGNMVENRQHFPDEIATERIMRLQDALEGMKPSLTLINQISYYEEVYDLWYKFYIYKRTI